MMRSGGAALALRRAAGGCAALHPPPKPAARSGSTRIPIRRPTSRYPGVVTVIRGATVFDGEGGRSIDGTVVLADGKSSRRSAAPTRRPRASA
jgi:hypothetical protein